MSRQPRAQFRKLYIGEWIARRGRRPRDVADAAGISEAYMSQLISGNKKNPSAGVLLDIAKELNLLLEDLYQSPPPEAALRGVDKLSPSDQATLARLLGQVRSSK